MKLKHHVITAALVLTSAGSQAQQFKAGTITVDHPYARSTAAGQQVGGGYLKLINVGGADRLVSASASVAKTVELHEMKMDGDVMKMRPVDGIALPPGKTVELQPGGFHIMFIGLKAPLKVGDSFPLKLKFEKAGEVTVDVKVEAAGAQKEIGDK